MKLSDFDYNYPEELVAQKPLNHRDSSRMMVLSREKKSFIDSNITSLPDFLNKEDILVINNSRVFPARLFGKRESGGEIEILLLEEMKNGEWRAIASRKKKLKERENILFSDKLRGTIAKKEEKGIILKFEDGSRIREKIEEIGLPPLPPYIKKKGKNSYTNQDRERYQTIYARHTGSAAAPTAGFHLTENIIQNCRDKGIRIVPVTLHVGIDTFMPVRSENIREHEIHGEYYSISKESEELINRTKEEGGRIIAVGTTTVRTLESSAYNKNDRYYVRATAEDGRSLSLNKTNLFIYPGYDFKIVDAILTNFHQPKSTLLMLVSAFAKREFVLQMYEEAIKRRYRLFSYGDSMLIT